MAFSEKFEDVMMVVAEKVGDNVYLSAIKDAFTAFPTVNQCRDEGVLI